MVEKIKPSYQTSFVPKNKNEQLAFDKLFESNQKLSELYAKLKKTIDILKDRKNILKYNGLKRTYELGWFTQEEYELLKEILEDES